jgi:hypothetical protein
MAQLVEMSLCWFPLLIGFASGYGVREWVSRRRRAAVLAEYYKRHPEERP